MGIQDLAAGVRPPIAGESFTRTIPAGTEVYAIPTAWLGQGVTWTVADGDCFVMFGTSNALVINPGDRAVLGGEALTADVNSAELYRDGEKGYGQLLKVLGLTHVAVASAGAVAGGTITFRRATFTNAEMGT